MSQPLISIIITILNGEKTLRGCLESIDNQLFTDYELVIVDGGSTDRTLAIIDESTITSKLVRVMPGIGLYAGLNEGVRLATGQWFYFMGSDDQFYETATLQKVADLISSKNIRSGVVVGNVQYTKQKSVFRPQLGSPYWLRHNVHHQGMFYSSDLFADLRYDETLSISSDYELNLKLALNNITHYYIDIIIGAIGEDGISNTHINRSTNEINIIHARLFAGVTRLWIVNFFRLKRKIFMVRRKYNLVDLKSRMRRLVTG